MYLQSGVPKSRIGRAQGIRAVTKILSCWLVGGESNNYNEGQMNLGLRENALQSNCYVHVGPCSLRHYFRSPLGSSCHPPPPLPPVMLWPKKAFISTHFALNSTLSGVGREESLVLVISL